MSESGLQYRALLIGVDAYRPKPLDGCVNDIDAVQRLLIDRAGVPRENIRRLASPHPRTPHETDLPEAPATLENIRLALRALAERAAEDDRIFVYYSGHGARVPFSHPAGYTICREALVPADADLTAQRRFLYDHELNELLRRIAARTSSVTCIFDCCHSAGVTRDAGPQDAKARALDPAELGWRPLPLAAEPDLPQTAAPPRLGGDYHVVSACLDFERAIEITQDGRRRGLFTSALLRALTAIPDPELPAVSWGRIWHTLRADVEARNPYQHVFMVGDRGRAVLAGPPVDTDPGLSIRRAGNEYRIEAGTLASVTESALIAVYGERPLRLPAPGSDEDRRARRGLLRVTSADQGSARARAEGAPFELPPGARGRIVEPGRAARLTCALVPPNEGLAAGLRASPWLEVVDEEAARVRVVAAGDRWLVTDDVHAATRAAALVVLRPEELARLRDVLEHYHQYARPLRLAESAGDLPGALQLEVLACPRPLPPAAAQDVDLPEAPTEGASAYLLEDGARVCFRVRNLSGAAIRVALLNAAASGRVQLLGDAALYPRQAHVFWPWDQLGQPFSMSLPPRKHQGIDRLIAVGTTALDRDLGYLRVDRRFADIFEITRSRGGEARDDAWEKDIEGLPPGEHWTATQVIIKTREG